MDEVKITVDQAKVMLQALRKVPLSEMTAEEVIVANSLHYAIKITEES